MLDSAHGIGIGGEDSIVEASRETMESVVDGIEVVLVVGVQEVIAVLVFGGGGRDGGCQEGEQNEAQSSHFPLLLRIEFRKGGVRELKPVHGQLRLRLVGDTDAMRCRRTQWQWQ